MSEKFNGFSQDEIKKYSVQNTVQKKITPKSSSAMRGTHGEGIRRMTDKMTSKGTTATLNKKQQQANKISQQMPAIRTGAGGIVSPIDISIEERDPNQGLSKSIEEALLFQPFKKKISNDEPTKEKPSTRDIARENKYVVSNGNEVCNSTDLNCSGFDVNDSTILPQSKNKKDSETDNENAMNLESPFKGISLRDFETHRKMIEEQNKQKKEMLHKAIEEYSLKTAAEARKIAEIKSELSKLDNDLALDVAILRKQIDMACVHFSNMEKQYMKIESQFLKAKIDLHNAAEKKELLTEHLCTVIAHNEDRKAQKLSELMQKVGLTSAGELKPKEPLAKESSN